MTEERYTKLEKCARDGTSISRDIIEESFPDAFRRIKNLAKNMGVNDYWSREVMEEYWYRDHNRVIDEGEGNYSKFPPSFRDFCKVHVAEVSNILPKGFILTRYEMKERPVTKEYVPDVKVGDRIRIHHAYASEITK